MATVTGATNEKVYSINKWLGLNEHPDGDTNLRMGEAAKLVNWKITRDGNLKRRPGLEFFAGLSEAYEIDRAESDGQSSGICKRDGNGSSGNCHVGRHERRGGKRQIHHCGGRSR